MPLEIITKIVKYLSLSDILSLTSVSKIWRCVYLNQNIIWKDICSNLNLSEDDYLHCFGDPSRFNSQSKAYIDSYSETLFGPMCSWWLVYTHYNMTLQHIKNDDVSSIFLKREMVEQSYCTDYYIINTIRCECCMRVEAVLLNSGELPWIEQELELFQHFITLYSSDYCLKIVGNKKFLVLEICSVIFVYTIIDDQFVPAFWKTIQTSVNCIDVNEDQLPGFEFLEDKYGTIIDLCEDKFAIIHRHQNMVFLVDLTLQTICKELLYCTKYCFVDSMKYAGDRLMIGISIKVIILITNPIYKFVWFTD